MCLCFKLLIKCCCEFWVYFLDAVDAVARPVCMNTFVCICIYNMIIYMICDRILAPTTYVFFASALPVIAFGAQLSRDTGWLVGFFLILYCEA